MQQHRRRRVSLKTPKISHRERVEIMVREVQFWLRTTSYPYTQIQKISGMTRMGLYASHGENWNPQFRTLTSIARARDVLEQRERDALLAVRKPKG